MDTPARWPRSPYRPVVELGYPYDYGPEYLYDQARYDTAARYGPWWAWRAVVCDVRQAHVVRGTAMPSQRPSSATCSISLTPRGPSYELTPWVRDPATGERPNRANLPMRVGITDDTSTWWLFTGWIDTWTDVDDLDDPTITITASDGFKHLALLDQAEQAPVGAGEAAGRRIARILERAGWTMGTELSAGSIPLQATTLATPALEEIYLTADTEAGVVWIDTAGRLVFVDRDWLRQKSQRVNWRIGDRAIDEQAVAASMLVTTADDMDIQNVVGISRVGGTAYWLEDADSIAKYGRHSWSRFDLPYASDTSTPTIAAIQLADRVARDYHLQAIVLAPITEAPAWAIVRDVELFDTVYVTRRRGAAELSEFAQVIGVDHTMGPGEFVTVLSLGPRIRQTNARYDVDRYDVATYSAT